MKQNYRFRMEVKRSIQKEAEISIQAKMFRLKENNSAIDVRKYIMIWIEITKKNQKEKKCLKGVERAG